MRRVPLIVLLTICLIGCQGGESSADVAIASPGIEVPTQTTTSVVEVPGTPATPEGGAAQPGSTSS